MQDCAAFSTLPELHSMGVMMFDPCWAEQTHASQRCELLYVLSGEVTLQLGGRGYTARPGDVLLVPSGTPHRDAFDLHAGLQVFLVFFTWEAEAEYFQRVSNEARHRLPAGDRAEIALQVERLRRDTGGDTPADRLVARSRLLTILLLLLRDVQLPGSREAQASGGRRRELMLAAKQYLDAHYARPIALEDIARALRVSTFHLSHVFSEENDFTLFSYLTTVRMAHAAALLRDGRLTVESVATSVGYENGNYFSKAFRKHFGYPPSAVRRGGGGLHDRSDG